MLKLWCSGIRNVICAPSSPLPAFPDEEETTGGPLPTLTPGYVGGNVTGGNSRLWLLTRGALGGCWPMTRGSACAARTCLQVPGGRKNQAEVKGVKLKTRLGRSAQADVYGGDSWLNSGISLRYKHTMVQWDHRTYINNDTERNAESPEPPHIILLPTVCQEWTQPDDSCWWRAKF